MNEGQGAEKGSGVKMPDISKPAGVTPADLRASVSPGALKAMGGFSEAAPLRPEGQGDINIGSIINPDGSRESIVIAGVGMDSSKQIARRMNPVGISRDENNNPEGEKGATQAETFRARLPEEEIAMISSVFEKAEPPAKDRIKPPRGNGHVIRNVAATILMGSSLAACNEMVGVATDTGVGVLQKGVIRPTADHHINSLETQERLARIGAQYGVNMKNVDINTARALIAAQVASEVSKGDIGTRYMLQRADLADQWAAGNIKDLKSYRDKLEAINLAEAHDQRGVRARLDGTSRAMLGQNMIHKADVQASGLRQTNIAELRSYERDLRIDTRAGTEVTREIERGANRTVQIGGDKVADELNKIFGN